MERAGINWQVSKSPVIQFSAIIDGWGVMRITLTSSVGTWWHYGFDQEFIFRVRMTAQQKRRALLKRLPPRKGRARHRRSAMAASRRLIKDVKKGKLQGVNRQVLLVRMKRSGLSDGLLPDRHKKWRPVLARLGVSKELDLKNFSFISNAVQTMEYLHRICVFECDCLDVRLNFDDEKCEDVGAYLVLAALKKDLFNVFSGGRLAPEARRALEAVRLREALGMASQPAIPHGPDIWPFQIRMRRPAGTSRSASRHLNVQTFEDVASSLAAAIDEWLGIAASQRLTQHGARHVQKIVGEILDNAERHSDPATGDGDWSMAGFMTRDQTDDGESAYRCNLAFLSVGKTISESIRTAHPSVIAALDSYLAMHGARPGRPRSEQYDVIYSIQDNVTRDPVAFREKRGGTGLLDTVDLFADLSGAHEGIIDASLCIVSGHTCVHFDARTLSGRNLSTPGERGQVWFNNYNNKELSPDPERVIFLPRRLNGTLVSMGFSLDRSYLESSL